MPNVVAQLFALSAAVPRLRSLRSQAARSKASGRIQIAVGEATVRRHFSWIWNDQDILKFGECDSSKQLMLEQLLLGCATESGDGKVKGIA